ncbi:FAR-17a/AIG1-like protein [Lipomyces arxii]|uniref:FAR-17a/AIG1-like protein n=1 Tax=Lipomyces arxii TaxID=56418 RepID=UPI0034CE3E34
MQFIMDKPTIASWPAALYLVAAAVLNADLNWVFSSNIPMNRTYGGQFQFLTILGVTVSYITVTTGLLAHIMSSNFLLRTKNRLLMVAAPVEILISLLYGSICLYDRSLLVPQSVTVFLPSYVDFGLHGAPSILLALDFFLFSPNWSLNPISTFILYAFIATGYWIWIHHTYSINNFFPYPLLELLTREQRAILFLVCTVLLLGVYLVLIKLHALIVKLDVKDVKDVKEVNEKIDA